MSTTATSGEPTGLDLTEFKINPEPRCACVLLIDTSGSMQGEKIAALNQGLRVFKADLAKDALASLRVEIAVVTFDSEIRVVQDFVTADEFEPPVLSAQGATHMAAGIEKALNMVEDRKTSYRTAGIACFRPWVLMITDGHPQGETEEMVKRAGDAVRRSDAQKGVAFFAIGVDGADMKKLTELAPLTRPPLKLQGLAFNELFMWASVNAKSVSRSKEGEMVALTPPGWAAV